MKYKNWNLTTIGVIMGITVLGLFCFNGEPSALARTVAVSIMGLVVSVVAARVRWERLISAAPWISGCALLLLMLVAFFQLEFCSLGSAFWIVTGTFPLLAAWMKVKYKVPMVRLLLILEFLVLACCLIVLGGSFLKNPDRCARLSAFFRGEQVETGKALATELSRWRLARQNATWFGTSKAAIPQVGLKHYPASRIVDAAVHGKCYPTMLCVMFVVLAIVLMQPIFAERHESSIRWFGILSMLWITAPLPLTLMQVFMVIPAVNIPIPFVNCGLETLFAWAMIGIIACLNGRLLRLSGDSLDGCRKTGDCLLA